MSLQAYVGFEEYALTSTPANLDGSELVQQSLFLEVNPNWSGTGIITDTNLVDGVGKNLRMRLQNQGLRFNMQNISGGFLFTAFHVYIATLSAVETPLVVWRRRNDAAEIARMVVLASGQVDVVYSDATRDANIATLSAGVHYHFEARYAYTDATNANNSLEIRLDGNVNAILNRSAPPRPDATNLQVGYADFGYSMTSSSASACHDVYYDNIALWSVGGGGPPNPFTDAFEGVTRITEQEFTVISDTGWNVVGGPDSDTVVKTIDYGASYVQATGASQTLGIDLTDLPVTPDPTIRGLYTKGILRPTNSGTTVGRFQYENGGTTQSGNFIFGITDFKVNAGIFRNNDPNGFVTWTPAGINSNVIRYFNVSGVNTTQISSLMVGIITADPLAGVTDDFEIPHEFNVNQLFAPTIENQPNVEIDLARIESTDILFAPGLENIPDNFVIPGPILSTNELFTPEFPQLQFILLDVLQNNNQLFTPTLQVLNLEIPNIDNSLVTQFFTPELENLPPPATNEYAFIFPRSRIFGFEFADIITAQGRIAGIESNPFRPNVPADVDETLPQEAARYFQNQAELLAQTYDGIQSGTIAFPAQLMRFIDDEPRFPVGAEGLFLHSTLGFMRGVYSQFFETTNAGAPVGISKFDFDKVSGVIENCLPDSVQGLLAAESAGAKDQYGWILIQGRTMSPVLASSDLNNGDEVGWTFTNQVGALPTTSIIARYRGQRLDQGELVTAGDLYVRRESSTAATVLADIEALQAALGLLDTDSSGLLTNIVAINQSIAGLQNALDDESAARIDSDNALTVTVNQLIAQVENLNDSIIDQLTTAYENADTELQTVLVAVDEDLQTQISALDASLGSALTDISNLQAESQEASEANLVTINSIYPRSLVVNWFF